LHNLYYHYYDMNIRISLAVAKFLLKISSFSFMDF
jgi:hypothetical protein